MRLSPHVKSLKPSPTLALRGQANALKKQGIHVYDLSVGEPDFPTAEPVREAANAFVSSGEIRYTPVPGTAALREKIAGWLKENRGVEYSADEILVGTGAKQCLFNTIHSLIGPGDEVLIPSPYWVSYPDQVKLAGGTPVFIECPKEDGFQLDPAAVEAAITPYTRMLVLNSPNNPTGAVYHPENVAAIAALAKKHDFWLLCDDIYDQLVYGDTQAHTALSLDPSIKDRVVLINGFSKGWAMTGWRLGYMAAPRPVIQAAISLQGAITSGTSAVSQIAGVSALDMPESYFAETRAVFERRLDLVMDELSRIEGVFCKRPTGAFYVLPDFSAYLGRVTPEGERIETTQDLSAFLLQEAHVACMPGEAFGFPGVLRFSYAASEETLTGALRAVGSAVQTLR